MCCDGIDQNCTRTRVSAAISYNKILLHITINLLIGHTMSKWQLKLEIKGQQVTWIRQHFL